MSALELSAVSRWFGNVVAVNDVTMTIGPGVTLKGTKDNIVVIEKNKTLTV